ncbi:hypothetical protein CI15_34335 [Paraburkholderia monticola]|uniref:Adhesin n=2 Tax=Paraburkholderia monticola TaxID=1399968 RepID=A0A149PC45_9BURK|nr:hypothetical protein CI15_34335 [Paraburkholderia monticola]
MGDSATANADKATALGRGAMANAVNSSAMGAGARAMAANSSAMGAGANATAANSVALGAGSTTTADLTTAGYNPGSTTLSGTAAAAKGEVSVGSAGNERRVTNVAAGSAATDAVNVSQLESEAAKSNAIGADMARALGGGATYNAATGAITAPSYSVGGTTVTSVGAAITNIDGRVTTNTGDIARNKDDITNVQKQLAESSTGPGLVLQDASTGDITVAKDTDGTVMNMAGTAGDRVVTGVANGAVNATSVDAINGSQLHAVASSAAAGLGGGSTVNPDGTISAPSYSVGGKTVHSVGDAVTNLDDRVTQNTSDITKLQTQVGDVGTQLSGAVQYDRNVDGSVNFNSVTLGGAQSAGPVVLTNVANGASQYDAVNYGQLSALQDQVTDINGKVSDLNTQVSNVQPAGDSNGVAVNAAMPGAGVASTLVGAGAVASGDHTAAIGANASATADNAVAVGANAAATGVNSTAMGTGSQATHANSVALGQGSVTDRDNSVSVGSVGNERQITNVAAGTAPTDAVNVGQLNSVRSDMDGLRKDAMGGVASAMAIANLPQSVLPGRTMVALGASTYGGQAGSALGVSYMTRDSKWTVKGAASTSTRGEVGASLSAGFYF